MRLESFLLLWPTSFVDSGLLIVAVSKTRCNIFFLNYKIWLHINSANIVFSSIFATHRYARISWISRCTKSNDHQSKQSVKYFNEQDTFPWLRYSQNFVIYKLNEIWSPKISIKQPNITHITYELFLPLNCIFIQFSVKDYSDEEIFDANSVTSQRRRSSLFVTKYFMRRESIWRLKTRRKSQLTVKVHGTNLGHASTSKLDARVENLSKTTLVNNGGLKFTNGGGGGYKNSPSSLPEVVDWIILVILIGGSAPS